MPDLLRYFPYSLTLIIENLTDSEFDPALWNQDPDMDMDARALRDQELLLDLIGCIDSPNIARAIPHEVA